MKTAPGAKFAAPVAQISNTLRFTPWLRHRYIYVCFGTQAQKFIEYLGAKLVSVYAQLLYTKSRLLLKIQLVVFPLDCRQADF